MTEKFCIFPIEHQTFWDLYKRQQLAIWSVEEIDFSNDYNDFLLLDENKQHCLKMILAFFANSDGLVNYNIKYNFLNDFPNEITYTYIYQMYMENIHNETYSLMIETLIKDENEKQHLFNSLKEIDIIKKLNEWGLRYSTGKYSLTEKVLVFICFEGIIFSGSFAFIFWLKKQQDKLFLNGLVKSNELISRDEGMHVEFGIEVFKMTNQKDKVPNFKLAGIIFECVNLAKKFNKEVLKIKQVGMNEDLMNKYTEFVADRIFVEIGLSKYFKINENPFSFMDTIGMVQKTNFHDSRPTEYQKVSFNSTLQVLDDF